MKDNKIKQYFATKTPEQIFSFWLMIGCFILMLFCAITRLCGGLWFQADLSKVQVPNQWWQDRIMDVLFVFETSIVYKILCRTKWLWCVLMSTIQILIIGLWLPPLWANILNVSCIIILPLCFHRQWWVLLDSLFLYLLCFAYAGLFLVGRIGNFDTNGAYNFITSILTIIDYKLFIVSLYLFIKNFGGVKLWKSQKRLICQRDL